MIADVEDAARLAFVALTAVEYQPHVSGAPGAQGVVALERGHQRLRVRATHPDRKVVELDDVGLSQRHRPLDEAFELAHVAGPVVAAERLGCRQR